MDHETEGNFYVVWQIKDDLNREKQMILDELYGISTSMWQNNGSDYDKERTLELSARVEDINRILDGIRLGYYRSP